MRYTRIVLLLLVALLVYASCRKGDPEGDTIQILSVTVDGSKLSDGAVALSPDPTIVIVFSSSIDPAGLRSALTLSSGEGMISVDPLFSNQASRVTLTPELEYGTTYTLSVAIEPIGLNGGKLKDELSLSFNTREDGTIHTMPPCTSASDACLHTIDVSDGDQANFSFYSSFPIYEDNAEWTGIKGAIVVVHGAGRNPDDYFNYIMGALQVEGLQDCVLVVSPFFMNEVDAAAGDIYWKGADWREGANAVSEVKISSYSVLDTIISRLADADHFPVLEHIIVTGNSSGGCFTHLYAAANGSEGAYPSVSFDYIVSESQYFYYPDGSRINETTNQLYTPTGCAGYDIWPIGYDIVPPFLADFTRAQFNERFISRSVVYLLGNGDKVDGSLNTSDCYATLLGSTRFRRGKHMYRYMELVYPGSHNHRLYEVNGVTHDGSAMYSSSTFRELIKEIFGI